MNRAPVNVPLLWEGPKQKQACLRTLHMSWAPPRSLLPDHLSLNVLGMSLRAQQGHLGIVFSIRASRDHHSPKPNQQQQLCLDPRFFSSFAITIGWRGGEGEIQSFVFIFLSLCFFFHFFCFLSRQTSAEHF